MVLRKLKDKVSNATDGVANKAVTRGGAVIDLAKERGKALADKAAEGKGAVVLAAKEGATALAEKIDVAQHDFRMKKYSPITFEQYSSPDFDLPMMVIVVDGDERKGIDVCEGAIGWLSRDAGLEVLHLYYEFIEASGLHFRSVPMCDKAYYQHPLDKGLFVEVNGYMDVMRQEQITELKMIGYKLGAKRCRLELFEHDESARSMAFSRSLETRESLEIHASADLGERGELSRTSSCSSRTLFDQSFVGDAQPEIPELKWYANNSEIRSLIEMRCSPENANRTTEYHVRLSSSSVEAMNVSLASKIEAALPGLGIRGNCKLKREAKKELYREMSFDLVF